MPSPFAQWMDRWENRLAARSQNERVVRPFEWGLDWLGITGGVSQPETLLADRTREWLADSDAFYSYPRPADYALDGACLTFSSPAPSPYPENNRVHADFFPAPGDRAVVVLPQWNSDVNGHVGLCRLLNRFGITALRMSMAYHDRRMPAELTRADYHVSANIGRTIHACRQSVVDARACLDWLEDRGYRRLGIVGTSLGSCVAFIAAAHEPRVRIAVYNHGAMHFGDVVWTGLSTRHIRQGLEGHLTQDQLRHCWAVISPASFLDRVVGRDLRSLLVWGCYDTSFLPCFTRQIIEGHRTRQLNLKVRMLRCGHYTTGQFPFNIIDGLTICRFAAANL